MTELPLTDEFSLYLYENKHMDLPSAGIFLGTKDDQAIDLIFAQLYEEKKGVNIYTYEDVCSEEWTRKIQISFENVKKNV